jgi:hypothetical protein
MEMDNGMNMGMEMDMGDTNDDNYMQMNMDTKGNDMVMNMK